MKKSEYNNFINPDEFAKLFEEWSAKGKPKGNDSLYLKIWNSVTNAVKACIGSLQNKYHCHYQDYDDKVMDGVILIMNKLNNMTETPKNIVNMCYLPILGMCCSKKAIAQEMENNSLSLDCLTNGGDSFQDLLYTCEDGNIEYGYDN